MKKPRELSESSGFPRSAIRRDQVFGPFIRWCPCAWIRIPAKPQSFFGGDNEQNFCSLSLLLVVDFRARTGDFLD